MDEYLWPARNVAEFAYCPRLFYFMEVEGIHLPSSDTEQGVAVHKRVNKPSADADREADPDKPRSVRSLTLTSPTLGLTATLDLAEITGNVAVPVEYRKGRPRLIAPAPEPQPADLGDPIPARVEPWPTDRVQVGLQAILLEEAGYVVREAVLYYAAEKRRLTIAVDDALKAEALATLRAAQACATGPRPAPLVNDPRCVRCSLQPICLPDEVNQQRHAADGVRPRQIWPPRDDALHIVAQHEGARVGVSGMALKVTDREGALVQEVPLASVEALALLGNVQISTQAVAALSDRGIPIAYLSGAGRLVAMIDPLDSVSAEVRRQQVRTLDKPQACLELSRALVVSKIINQRTLLMRNHEKLPETVADELAREAEQAMKAESLDVLRGHEGQAAALYFAHFAGLLRGEIAAQFDAHGRQRRPPPASRPGECHAVVRLHDADARVRRRVAPGPPRAQYRRLPHLPSRPPGARLGSDGAVPAAGGRFNCDLRLQPPGIDRRALPPHQCRLRLDRLRPPGLLRRLRPPHGHRDHASGLRLPPQLSPHADAARPDDRRLDARRSPHVGVSDDSIRRSPRPRVAASPRLSGVHMRRCYLVCYDIRDPKRWRKVFKVMKGHGEHWQYSVFFCVLRDIDRVRMQSHLEEHMNLAEDQALILDLGPDEQSAREAATVLGPSLPAGQTGVVVI